MFRQIDMEILKNFGFEPILFTAQVVNFLVIFFLLKKLMYKPVLKMLEQRKHTISQGLKDAEEAQLRLENATKEEEDILKKAQSEARKLIDDAKVQSANMVEQTEGDTRKRVEAMLSEARQQIAYDTAQAEKKLEKHVATLAVAFLQQSVKELFGPQEQELIMKNALKKLKKTQTN